MTALLLAIALLPQSPREAGTRSHRDPESLLQGIPPSRPGGAGGKISPAALPCASVPRCPDLPESLWLQDCARCGAPLREGARFCTQCGQKLEPPRCPKCKSEAMPKDKFCAQCGECLAPADDLAPGFDLLRNGEFERAIKFFTEYLAGNPHRAPAFAGRARAHAGLGQFDKALEDANRAVALNQDDPASLETRAEIKMMAGQDDAVMDLDKAIKLDARRPSSWRLRAEFWLRRLDFERAIADATKAVEIDASPLSLLVRGRIRLAVAEHEDARGEEAASTFAKAITDFDAAIARDARSAEAFVSRAEAWAAVARHLLSRNKDAADSWRRCQADADEALRLHPQSWRARLVRGTARLAARQVDEAVADFTEVIRLKPSHPEAWSHRAGCRMLQGDKAGALADFERALEVAPPKWPRRDYVEKMIRELRK